jgi:hypothetical protein
VKAKKKHCNGCESEQFIWKNDKGNRYCKNCWLRKQAVTGKRNKPTNSRKPIAPRSPKRAKQEREYSKLRKDFLLSSPICTAKLPNICTHHSTDVHHMKGRIGPLLTDVNYFLSVCRQCHDWIEGHPIEAKELGYSISKIT